MCIHLFSCKPTVYLVISYLFIYTLPDEMVIRRKKGGGGKYLCSVYSAEAQGSKMHKIRNWMNYVNYQNVCPFSSFASRKRPKHHNETSKYLLLFMFLLFCSVCFVALLCFVLNNCFSVFVCLTEKLLNTFDLILKVFNDRASCSFVASDMFVFFQFCMLDIKQFDP